MQIKDIVRIKNFIITCLEKLDPILYNPVIFNEVFL